MTITAINVKHGVPMTKVYVFSDETLEQALSAWEARQIAEHPDQEERIKITVVAMRWFLDSEEIETHKMVMKESE